MNALFALLISVVVLVAGCTVAIDVTASSTEKRPAGFFSDEQKRSIVANEIGYVVSMNRQQVLAGGTLDVANIAERRLAAAGYRNMVCRTDWTSARSRVLYVKCAQHTKLQQYVRAPYDTAFTLRLQPLLAFGMAAPLLIDFGYGRYQPPVKKPKFDFDRCDRRTYRLDHPNQCEGWPRRYRGW